MWRASVRTDNCHSTKLARTHFRFLGACVTATCRYVHELELELNTNESLSWQLHGNCKASIWIQGGYKTGTNRKNAIDWKLVLFTLIWDKCCHFFDWTVDIVDRTTHDLVHVYMCHLNAIHTCYLCNSFALFVKIKIDAKQWYTMGLALDCVLNCLFPFQDEEHFPSVKCINQFIGNHFIFCWTSSAYGLISLIECNRAASIP